MVPCTFAPHSAAATGPVAATSAVMEKALIAAAMRCTVMVKQKKHTVTDCDMHFGAKLRYDLPVPAAVFGVERGRYHSHVSPLAQTAVCCGL